jgi:hypothetical protein
LTRFGTVSYRPSPHSSVFRVTDTREHVRGTGEFRLRRRPFGRFKRSRVNQPDPTFPQSPGIILETNSFNLSIATARFVLSMNCGHHNLIFFSNNDLICTAYSLKTLHERSAKNINEPVKSMPFLFPEHKLFTALQTENSRGEQVLPL